MVFGTDKNVLFKAVSSIHELLCIKGYLLTWQMKG